MRRIPVTGLTMTFLMLLSALGVGWYDTQPDLEIELEVPEEPMAAPTNPGHTVFAQYITSDNCGFCYQYGSPGHKQVKNSLPDTYVYISYHSANYGNTADAESGNIAPIMGVSHLQESGGAPKTSFGDATLNTGCGSNTCWDSYVSSGGNMHSTASDYAMTIGQSDNGDGTSAISVNVKYTGSGTPPSSFKLYAAVTEEVCNSHAYSDGTKGGNCWEAWLLNNGGYASNSGNVGGGTGFETISLTGNQWSSTSWTVPNSLVGGGASNMNVVSALFSGWSTSSFGEDVFVAADGTMAPPIDLGIQDFTVSNSNGAESWVTGDVLDLTATISNNGIDTYNDGGMIRFFQINGATETEIDTGIINTLTTSGSGSTQVMTAQFDTSSLSENAWDVALRAKITDTTGDGNYGNNVVNKEMLHDMPPICSNPTIIGDPEVDRGETVVVEVRGDPSDGVDEMDTMVPKLEISIANADSWSSSLVMGGQTLMGEGTSNERYEFQFEPDSTMMSGLYDIRVQFVDAGGQESDWVIKEDAFSLNNALPVIVPEPYPSVKVEVETAVSMVGHISDMEMPLSELEITSTSPNFISWDSTTGKMTVLFNNIQRDVHGTPMPSGIYVIVDDGEDTTSGTLLFNVIENGQPRWGAVTSIHMDEGSSDSIMLSNYLSDTDDTGASVDSSSLIVAVLENDNRDLITASVTGQTLNIETIDQDVFGQARLTLRASDGTQFSDTVVIVSVNNINDAPTIDLSEFDGMMLKKGEEKIIMLADYMDDVDDDNNDILVSVAASPAHSARHSMLSNALTMGWDTTGDKTVMITVIDRHDDSSTYTFTVVVYDALPLYVSDSDPSADIFVEIENGLVGKDARVTLTVVNANLGLNHLKSGWQICSILDGICYEFQTIEHTGVQTSWSFFLPFDRSSDGLLYNDQLKLVDVNAVDTDGNDRKYHGTIYWNITEFPVDPSTMDSRELDAHIMTLENRIASLEEAIASLEEGTDEYVEKQSELNSTKDDHKSACAVDGAKCISDDVQSQVESAKSSNLNFTYIGIAMGAIILVLLSILLLGGRKGDGDSFTSLIDHTMVLPATDTVANSSFGGAQELFAAPPPQAGPPIPAAGLPVGWSMEQWQHYGAQYLQENGL
ncbi:hypothetical protein OAJ94_01225 [Deltaproteobacteria bacterium]|nr:hypothetical protein [Deltaproteobacteria bacterium]